MDHILVMILCGGKGERIYPLTRDRAKPSVPFLGIYRIIDFSLSNCLNSGLRKIVLLTQHKSLSLERHIRVGWNIFHHESGGYIFSLPAQGRMGDYWYEGTADAVLKNIYTLQQENPEATLILSGDHVYKADYREMIKFLHEKSADGVLLAKIVHRDDASRFGVIKADEGNKVVDFLEKPKNPPSIPNDPDHSLVSMGVYLFRTPTLIKTLIKDARDPKSDHDFGKDILPLMIKERQIYTYFFQDYWEDIGTIDAFWEANMSFLSKTPPFDLHGKTWPIRTFQGQYPPSIIQNSIIHNSIISSGCYIDTAHIKNSIISPGVKIGKKTDIQDAIIFNDVVIGEKAQLKGVIIDKLASIENTAEIGLNKALDAKSFKISQRGIRIIPKGWRME